MELERQLARLLNAEGEDDLHDADVAFHRAIAGASRNPLFALVLDGLTPLLRESRRAAWRGYTARGGDLSRAMRGHEEIAQMVRDADEAGALEAMARDLHDARTSLGPLLGAQRMPSREASSPNIQEGAQ